VREVIGSLEHEYRRYKGLAEATFEQATADELSYVAAPEGNSIAGLVWHVLGQPQVALH
jgi:hypothetical protein